MQCLICGFECNNKRVLGSHLIKHKITSEEYTIKYIYNGIRPLCLECGENTRYVSFEFKKYCNKHSYIAESNGGQVGGKIHKAWNKGLTKETNLQIKKQSENSKGEKNPFYGKKHTFESLIKMKKNSLISESEFNERLKNRKQDFNVITSYKEYFSRQHQYLEMICTKCGSLNKKTLQAFERLSTCDVCEPSHITSIGQTQIYEYCSSLIGAQNIVFDCRTIIPPYEVDIFVPSHNLGIEYHGLYWHGEFQKDQNYHKNKADLAKEAGINLFQIFADEWETKQNLVKSMIKYRLKLCPNHVGARKLNVVELSSGQRKEFFNKSHIAGDIPSLISFGLQDKDGNILSAISLRKPFQKKYEKTIEIARFANMPEFSISGGFQKLFSHSISWAKENGYNQILSYADRRIGEGTTYQQSGFEYNGLSTLNYYYSDGVSRFNRLKFCAQSGKCEKDIAQEAGMFRIFGAGNNIYLYHIQ